jgi:hypothetical protein
MPTDEEPVPAGPGGTARTIAYGFSGCRPDGNYDVVEFAVSPGETCGTSTCVQHVLRSNYECFQTEFPDLYLHVECHIPSRVHKVFTVASLNATGATLLFNALCTGGSTTCENYAFDATGYQVSFDYLRPAEPSVRRRRTTGPCDDLYGSENGTAAALACCEATLGVGACTGVESTANFSGTPTFPAVGSGNFVACGTDGDCAGAPGLNTCVANACVAAAGGGSTSTAAPTTAAAVPTTTTTVFPVPPEEAFPGALVGTVGTVAGIQAAATVVEILTTVVVGGAGGAVDAAGSLLESFL